MPPWQEQFSKEPIWRITLAAMNVLAAATIMASWKLGLESLVRIHPDWSPTQFNTALTCLLLGLSSLFHPVSRWATVSLASGAFLLSLLTGSQYLLGLELGIDQLFHTHQFGEPGAAPGRMSLNSSLVLTALSLSFVVQAVDDLAWRRQLAMWSISVSGGFLAAYSLGYLIGQVSLFNLTPATGMGAMTLLMSGSLAAIKISRVIPFSLPKLARLTKAVLIAAGLFLSSLTLAVLMGLSVQHRAELERGAQAELGLLSQTLQARLNEQALALQRMADRWRMSSGTPERAWRDDATNYVTDTRLMDAVLKLDEAGRVLWREPREADFWPEGSSLAGDPLVARHLAEVRATQALRVSPVQETPDGQMGFLIIAPVFTNDGAFDGALIEINPLSQVRELLYSLPRPSRYPVEFRLPDEDLPDGSLSRELNFGNTALLRLVASEADMLRDAPGNTTSFLFLAFAIMASSLALFALQLVLRDQAQQERLRQANKELEIANAELDSFAYTASHDLKSPLRAIRQLVDWLDEDLGEAIPENARRYMTLLHSRVGRLQSLLDALLEYSRIGRKAVSRSTVELDRLVQSAVDLLSLPGGHVVELVGGDFEVNTDTNLMRVIAMNLVNNASKHHDRPSARIRVSLYQGPENWCMEFSDDGPGIPPELHDRIFGMFETVKSRDEVEASGMGLAIAQKAVTRLDGTISLISDPALSRGSRFVLEFPNA